MTDAHAHASLSIGVPGFTYADLFDPSKLRSLHETFDAWFRDEAPDHHARFDSLPRLQGEG